MAIDQATLIQMVYDSVFSQLIKPTATGTKDREILLSFEFPGQQVDETEYQNPWTPRTPDGSQFATEMFSNLIDAIPIVDSVYVDSGVTAEEMYEFALGAAAVPLPPDATGEIPVNPVNTVINNARQSFEQTRLASALNPALNYHPSYATPSNWADPIGAQSWTSIAINSNTTTVKADSAFLRFGGAKRLREGVWKIPPKLIAAVEQPQVFVPPTVQPKPDISVRPDIGIKPGLVDRIGIKPGLIDRIGMRSSGTAAVAEATLTKAEALAMQNLSPNPLLMRRINPDLIDKIAIAELKNRPIDQTTQNIQISFRCCRVNFTRPWLLKSLLEINGWRLPGQAAGSLSSGKLQDNNGTFPLLPIGFIAIRDLKIQANWGQVDRDIAAKSVQSENTIGFGPFALSGQYAESGKGYAATFDGTTIHAPGLQILGWISLVNPYTPPA
jgi:hypothetical protein